MAEESVGDAGTQHLGYFTGVWSPDGCAILAHGYTGALHLWRRQPGGGGRWVPEPALGGHYGPVVDACWAADGACLLTVSADQTARLSTALAPGGHWCELARPQVHGHDFACVAALPQLRDAPGCFLYASGSEEKVIRVFQGPQAFADTLALARGFEPAQPPAAAVAGGHMIEVLGATLPALGLSNKAVYALEEEDADANEEGEEGGGLLGGYTHGPDLAPASAVPAAVSGPPLEEHLAQNTLWPEIHKLYGHGNDLFALAADPQGQYLASACRAQAPDVAAVWLWDTRRWTGAGVLAAHTLTVTQLAFSPSGDALASASRDRGVALFARQETGGGGSGGSPDAGPPFRLVGRVAKAHGRIVWGLDWSPDGLLIATGSRDASVKLWSCRAGIRAGGEGAGAALVLPEAPAASLSLPDSVRAVAFAPVCRPGRLYHLAVGLEDGSLQLLRVWFSGGCEDSAPPVAAEAAPVWQSSPFMQHAAAVRRLCWRRREESEAGARGSADYLMASVGEDHAVRVFAIDAALLDPAA